MNEIYSRAAFSLFVDESLIWNGTLAPTARE